MTPSDRRELRQVLAQELRHLGLLELPEPLKPPPLIDDEAEQQTIALEREGVPVPVRVEDLGRPLHQLVLVIVRTCNENQTDPTTQLVCKLAFEQGWSSRIEPWIEELLDLTPIQSTPAVVAGRINHAAHCRRMLTIIQRLDTIYRDPHLSHDARDALIALWQEAKRK